MLLSAGGPSLALPVSNETTTSTSRLPCFACFARLPSCSALLGRCYCHRINTSFLSVFGFSLCLIAHISTLPANLDCCTLPGPARIPCHRKGKSRRRSPRRRRAKPPAAWNCTGAPPCLREVGRDVVAQSGSTPANARRATRHGAPVGQSVQVAPWFSHQEASGSGCST